MFLLDCTLVLYKILLTSGGDGQRSLDSSQLVIFDKTGMSHIRNIKQARVEQTNGIFGLGHVNISKAEIGDLTLVIFID